VVSTHGKIASKIITALSEGGNHPIGEKPVLDEVGNIQIDSNGNVVTTTTTSHSTAALIMTGILVLFIVAFVIVVAFVFMK